MKSDKNASILFSDGPHVRVLSLSKTITTANIDSMDGRFVVQEPNVEFVDEGRGLNKHLDYVIREFCLLGPEILPSLCGPVRDAEDG